MWTEMRIQPELNRFGCILSISIALVRCGNKANISIFQGIHNRIFLFTLHFADNEAFRKLRCSNDGASDHICRICI